MIAAAGLLRQLSPLVSCFRRYSTESEVAQLSDAASRQRRGFWKDLTKQKRILEIDIAPRLGIKSLDDYYKVSTSQMRKHGGASILAQHGDSVSGALKAIYPEHPWRLWMFTKSPQKFWKGSTMSERRDYLDWVGVQLGVREKNDWYRVKISDVERLGVRSFLTVLYGGSLIAALKNVYYDYDWQPWQFHQVQRGWWSEPSHRKEFLEYVAKQLGISSQHMEKWYSVNPKDVTAFGGHRLLESYGARNLASILMAAFPEYEWKPWLFKHVVVPKGFWQNEVNRRKYLSWLGQEKKFTKAEDWAKLTRADIIKSGGATMLELYFDQSVHNVLGFLFPGHVWNEWDLEGGATKGFWQDINNHRRFVSYLSDKLHIGDSLDKWYQVTLQEVINAGGGSFLRQYNNSLFRALVALYPDHTWDHSKIQPAASVEATLTVDNVQRVLAEADTKSLDDWYFVYPEQAPDVYKLADTHFSGSIWSLLRFCHPDHVFDSRLASSKHKDDILVELGSFLAEKLGLKNAEAWFSLNHSRLSDAFGPLAVASIRLLGPQMFSSTFLDRKLDVWRLAFAPETVWDDREVRLSFLSHVEHSLNITKETRDKWYSVSRAEFRALGGRVLLQRCYKNSILFAVSELYPSEQWYPWPFFSRGSAAAFWSRKENVDPFFTELKKVLKVSSMEDWYKLQQTDFVRLRGRRLLGLHGNSPLRVLQWYFSDHEWEPWKFEKLPREFWNDQMGPETARRIAEDVAARLGITRREEWYRVSLLQLREVGIWYILESIGGLYSLLRLAYPKFRWSRQKLALFGKKSAQRALVQNVRSLFPLDKICEDFKLTTPEGHVELDIYLPQASLAFEYQGIFHYRDVAVIGQGDERIAKDAEKASICAKAGITLLSVPYWWDGTTNSLANTIQLIRPDLISLPRGNGKPIPSNDDGVGTSIVRDKQAK